MLKVRDNIAIYEDPGWYQQPPGTDSGENILHDVSGDIGQTEIPSKMTMNQPLMVESHEMEDGRVEVMEVDGVISHVDPIVIGGAVDHAAFHSAAGQE